MKNRKNRSGSCGRAALASPLFALGLLAQEDPFSGLSASGSAPTNAPAAAAPGWTDNLLFRKEAYLLFAEGRDSESQGRDMMSRVSAGFEIQKRFATPTRTVASADYQGRIVYRDKTLDTRADPMGRDASPWEYETHNAYADLYNLFGEPGRFNLRGGYFYQPFGLSQQTDTHGTLLQLSNDSLFGTERDWQAALYGALNDSLDYNIAYLLGAGPDHELEGQAGLVAARISLNNDWLFRHGLEGGVSVAAGERVDEHAAMRGRPAMHMGDAMRADPVVKTLRVGADARKRVDTGWGPLTFTEEIAAGQDEEADLFSSLTQADWLHPSRRFGAAAQYTHFWQNDSDGQDDYTDARVSGVLTYYLRNDVGNANLHWVALAVERQVRQTDDPEDTVVMVQYYRYW